MPYITVSREKVSGSFTDVAVIDEKLYVVERHRDGTVMNKAHLAPIRDIETVITALTRLKVFA